MQLLSINHTYNNIDEIDYQILVEADFLVNIMEDGDVQSNTEHDQIHLDQSLIL